MKKNLLLLSAILLVTSLAAQDEAYAPGAAAMPLFGSWQRAPAGSDEAAFAGAAESVLVLPRASLQSPSRPASELSPWTYRRIIPLGAAAEREYALLVGPGAGITGISVNGQILHRGGVEHGTIQLRFTAAGPAVSILVTTDPEVPGAIDFERGGLANRVLFFGDQARIDNLRLVEVGVAIFSAGFFLFVGLFMAVLFLFWRKNRDFLAFAWFALASGGFYLVKSATYLPFPLASDDLAYHVATALQYSGLALFLGLALGRVPRLLILASMALVLAAGALPFAFPDYMPWFHLALLSVGGLMALAYLLLAIVRSFRKDSRARWLALAQLFPIASIAAHQLLPGDLGVARYLEPAGIALFTFLCMLMLVSKIGTAFEDQESLNDYVDEVTKSLHRFIPSEFLEALEKERIVDVKLGDHVKKDMTIFFSDIRAFTELSERLTVEENFAFINSYLSRVVPLVTEHGGFIDKYIGDAIMALFSGNKGPDQSIRAAIAMQKVILEYNGHRAKMGYVPIQMGVGIHTGSLMLGVVGVEDRMENTVISDAVNLSSRLQAIAKLFNIGILVSEQTFKALEDPGSYAIRFMGKVRVKGKEAPVSTFEVLDGLSEEIFEKKTKSNTFFEQGMIAYYQKDYGNAMYFFKRVIDAVPQDGAAVFYLEQCLIRADRGKVGKDI
jgi:class 3 adenylate cyclase